jgi:hypothetical protein
MVDPREADPGIIVDLAENLPSPAHRGGLDIDFHSSNPQLSSVINHIPVYGYVN